MGRKSLKYVCMVLFCALTIFLAYNVSVASSVEVKEITTPEELDAVISEANKDKLVIVNFFSTQRYTAEIQTSILVSIYNKHKEDVEIIGISYEDNGKKLLPEFIEKHNIKYPVYLTNKYTKNVYGVKGTPTIFVCDKDGDRMELRSLGLVPDGEAHMLGKHPRGVVPETVLDRTIRAKLLTEITSTELSDILESYRSEGKIVLLGFWSTRCDFSKDEMFLFGYLYDECKEKGIEIIGIFSNKDSRELTPVFMKENRINYPIYTVGDNVMKEYGVTETPVILGFDEKGNISQYIVFNSDGTPGQDIIELLNKLSK